MFRKLRADEIEVRVGSVKQGAATLLLYKNARVDMDILDETVGAMYWKREHSRDNANCTVSIYCRDLGEWVSKEDTGTESNTEKEKGLASDSFKRACVNWGIGRELYTAPKIKIKCETQQKSNGYGYELVNRWEFWGVEVEMIDYDENGVISALTLTKDGNNIFNYKAGRKPQETKTGASRHFKEPDGTVEKEMSDINEPITKAQAQTINAMLTETKANRKAFLEYYKIDDIMKMNKSQYGDALNMLHVKKLNAEEKGKVIGVEK